MRGIPFVLGKCIGKSHIYILFSGFHLETWPHIVDQPAQGISEKNIPHLLQNVHVYQMSGTFLWSRTRKFCQTASPARHAQGRVF